MSLLLLPQLRPKKNGGGHDAGGRSRRKDQSEFGLECSHCEGMGTAQAGGAESAVGI